MGSLLWTTLWRDGRLLTRSLLSFHSFNPMFAEHLLGTGSVLGAGEAGANKTPQILLP